MFDDTYRFVIVLELGMLASMKISIVIAIFRNEETIFEFHDKIKALFDGQLHDYDYEIIFVDDGSDDASLDRIKSVTKINTRVRFVSFTRNFGQMSAILAGLERAEGDAAINISADLQDPIELMADMVKQWREGAEIVIAFRESRKDSLSSVILSRIAYNIFRLSEPKMPIGGFDYVLIDRKPLDVFNGIKSKNRFFQGDLLWMGHRLAFISYIRRPRPYGKSGYNFSKKLKNFLDALIDSSYLPIRLISALGICTAFVGLMYSVSIVYDWHEGGAPFAGWAPIMIVILLTSGLLMLMLGILGEYVWRINDELRGKPRFIVDEESINKSIK